jgi:hypothetical protein
MNMRGDGVRAHHGVERRHRPGAKGDRQGEERQEGLNGARVEHGGDT